MGIACDVLWKCDTVCPAISSATRRPVSDLVGGSGSSVGSFRPPSALSDVGAALFGTSIPGATGSNLQAMGLPGVRPVVSLRVHQCTSYSTPISQVKGNSSKIKNPLPEVMNALTHHCS